MQQTKQPKPVRGHDYSNQVIWGSATVGMIRYAAAFLASDVGQIVGVTSNVITVLLGISGFAMGLLGTFGTAYLFDGWRKKMPSNDQKWPFKFRVLTIFVLMAFLCELLILVPFTVSRIQHDTMSDVLRGGVWWWSVAVNIMPMLLLGGVSVGNQIVAEGSKNLPESFAKVSDEQEKLSEKVSGDWRKVRPYLSDEEVKDITQMSTANIQKKYHLKTAKTALNWRGYAQKELSEQVPS
jgi:hypothetical protein